MPGITNSRLHSAKQAAQKAQQDILTDVLAEARKKVLKIDLLPGPYQFQDHIRPAQGHRTGHQQSAHTGKDRTCQGMDGICNGQGQQRQKPGIGKDPAA